MTISTEELESWLAGSRLVRAQRELDEYFAAQEQRGLTSEEIDRLAAQGNTAEDWSRVSVFEAFETDAVVGCRFEGEVLLGVFTQGAPSAGVDHPGLFFSTLSDCRIASGVRIARCGRLSRYRVGEGAAIEGAQAITLAGETSKFGNSLQLFHHDLNSRRLRAVAELRFDWAVWATGPDAAAPDRRSRLEQLFEAADRYAASLEAKWGHIGPGARITAAGRIEDCWIGEGTEIDSAGSLRQSTFWATAEEPTIVLDGARIVQSLVGPGCRIEGPCSIERSILFEHVSVQPHAAIKESAIGANSRLGECEAKSSLLGPFTTAIHHGLIISAWWPEGRGNLSYGANVGSNHTGRAPDQEIFPGEGVFFGLGCNIKFPCNFRQAPYTLLATGVDALPQRVLFPFSLIVPASRLYEGLSPALNEIRPGWGLLHNAYGLERQEQNLMQRNRARRTTIPLAIFRRELAEACLEAGERIAKIAVGSEIYTENDQPGLGKNFMTEAGRLDAQRAYEQGARFGAARCLLRALAADDAEVETGLVGWAAGVLGTAEPEPLLEAALEAERAWADLVRQSRAKDMRRGKAILDDYEYRHVSADRDPVLRATDAALGEHVSRRGTYLGTLKAGAAQMRAGRG